MKSPQSGLDSQFLFLKQATGSEAAAAWTYCSSRIILP